MRAFWIKVINILIIGLLLFMYQTGAHSYSRMNKTIDKLKEKLQEEKQNSSQTSYKDGSYKGTGTGYKGDITVAVTVESGQIKDIQITDTADDQAYFSKAEALTEDIIDKQTTEGVDTVSGATFSSNGIIEAVEKALEGAAG